MAPLTPERPARRERAGRGELAPPEPDRAAAGSLAPPGASLRLRVVSRHEVDIARQRAREIALRAGLDRERRECVALAASELAMNLVRYADGGEIILEAITGPRGAGVRIEASDHGPGIIDLPRALEDGYTTGGGLGSGLPAVRRLMDDFDITSTPTGTRVVARKWQRSP